MAPLCCLLLALALRAGVSEPVRCVLTLEGAGAQAPVAAKIHAEAVAGVGELPSAVEQSVRVPGEATLHLAEGVTWRLAVTARGFWARAVTLEPAARRRLEITLVPTGTLAGTLRAPRGEHPPESVRVHFSPAAASASALAGDEGVCSLEGTAYACEVPAGSWNLRLAAAGFAPRYLWGVTIVAGGRHDLADWALQRGASVSGWVEAPVDLPRGSRVVLAPVAAARQPIVGDAERRLRQVAAPLSELGFFQLVGVRPGRYSLVAEGTGLVGTPIVVDVVEARESRVTEVLRLDLPAELIVTVDPALDPAGRRFRVVARAAGENRRDAPVREARLDRGQGVWRIGGLVPGPYLVAVLDSSDNLWATASATATADGPPLPVTLSVVAVHGVVTLGDRPLAAELTFRREGSEVHLASSAEGEIEGFLPGEGDWYVGVRSGAVSRSLSVEVRAAGDSDGAEVAIHLPATRLVGSVVDGANGRTVAGATVRATATGEGGTELFTATSDEEGRFVLESVPPGGARVRAMTPSAESDEVRVKLAEGEEREVRLVLSPRVVLRGVVTSRFGTVPRAAVVAVPHMPLAQAAAFTVPKAWSGVDGRFELRMPPATVAASVVVAAAGYGVSLFKVGPAFDREVTIYLEGTGGELRIATTASPSGLLLVSGGALVSPLMLGGLVRQAPKADGNTVVFTLPLAEPGTYAACWHPLGVFAPPAALDDTHCASGVLTAGSSLMLEAPAPLQ